VLLSGRTGTLVDLGTLGGTWSTATGINSQREVVGTSTIASGAFKAFFSDASKKLVDLGTLGGTSSYGMAINNACEIVGHAQTSQGLLHAFVWKTGTLIDLGTLGGAQSYAYAINDAGTVVGYSWMTGNLVTHGFIHSGGMMIDLNRLLPANSGWTIEAAYGINDSGEIVGTGTLNGKTYAVKLLPDPAVKVPKAR
jgi:probable HAF family extracellular repeat protein